MVAGSQGSSQKKRAERERSRVYAARAEVHSSRAARRRRDSVIAGVAGGAVVIAALIGQTLYFTVGPGAPEPTATTSPSATPDPSATPEATTAQ